jgi:hypothetical protein
MRHLELPATDAEDDAVLRKLCAQPKWAAQEVPWLESYASYRQHSGSAFALAPRDFGPGVDDRQYDLYDSRKRSGPLARMRRKKGLLSCPVCGSPVTGHLDHYLPRRRYPEFSIMRLNLVPACAHCNSGVKGDTVHGGKPRRFIHPYFDVWANDDLWDIDIVRPLEAATFLPRPVDTLVGDRAEIVTFHLENVLGDQFHLSMENDWSTYPEQIAIRVPKPDIDDVIREIGRDLRVAIASKGNNSWQAAFFRGLSADAEAMEFLRAKALAISQTAASAQA